MEKISKAKARKFWNEGKPFYMRATKIRDIYAMQINPARYENHTDADFDNMVNQFRYYNCNTECGRGIQFLTD